MNYLKKCLETIKSFFLELSISCKFLMIILLTCFPVVYISIFIENLDATGNLVTIRTIFSSIIGYFLEKSTSEEQTNIKLLRKKIKIVGIFAIITTIIIILSYIYKANENNPSLILIKNLLFSSIGFLTSASTSDKTKN